MLHGLRHLPFLRVLYEIVEEGSHATLLCVIIDDVYCHVCVLCWVATPPIILCLSDEGTICRIRGITMNRVPKETEQLVGDMAILKGFTSG